MNKIFKHKRGASGLKVVCEFAKSHCSSGEKTAVSSGAHVSTRSGFKSLSIALISALTLGITTPAMAVVFGEGGYKGGSSTTNSGAVAGGNSARATAPGSTAIGVSVTASGGNSTAIGMNAESMTGQALAVGSYARARGDQSTAIGNDVTSIGKSSIAIGNDDISSVYNNNPLFTAEELAKKDIIDELDKLCAVASCESMYGFKKVGNSYTIVDEEKYNKWSPTFTTGAGAIAIGSRTVAMSDGATAIGTLAVAAGKKSAALGSFSKATAENALAFGAESIASGRNSSVFGIGAKASKDNSMAIGTGAVSNIENSIALGVNSKTDYTGSNKRGYMPGNGYMLPMASSAGVISVGSATQPRRIVNLASGALDTDAVNVAQLKSLAENLGVDDIADNTDKTMRYLSVSRSTGSAADIQNLIQKEKDFKTYSQYRKYHDIMVLGKNRTGTTDYDNEINELATKISNMEGKYNGFHDAITTPAGLTGISPTSSEQDVKTVTDSINAYTTTILTAAEKTKIKSHNAANEGATGADAIAIGYSAKSTGAQAVSLGKTATASGASAIAIGNGAKADGGSSINIGSGVRASLGGNVTLIGNNNTAGENSSASLSNTSIIGSGNKIDGGTIDHNLIIGTRHEINQDNDSKGTKLTQNVIIGDHINFKNSEEVISIGSDTDVINSQGGITIGGDSNVLGGYTRTGIKGKGAIAIGAGAQVGENFNQNTGDFAEAGVSLGVKSKTTVAQGVALGSESVADRVSIANNKTTAYNGSDTNVANTIKGNYGAVSVGNSNATRQITNVAAGSQDSDAVNVAQLKSVSNAISQQGFNVKGKNSAGTDDTTNLIKSGKIVEFASADKYLKISHTATTGGDSKFTFDVDENELKKTIGATSTGNYSLEFIGDTGANITRDQANQELKIKGGVTTTADLSTNNIGVEASGDTLNIKLAKALKGLTSAEFKNTAGDTTVINGDGIKYNPKDNTDTKQTVSLGKDGINAGSKIISNVATGVNEGDAVNKKQAETIAKDAAKDFAKDKLKAGDNVTISAPNADGEVTISATDKDTKTTVIKGSGIEVTGSENGDTKTYTVGLDTATMNKINNAANATNAMQSLNVKAGTVNAELDKTNNTLEFATGNNLKVELDAANRKVTYSLADDIKFNNIKTDTINAGKDGSDGTPGKNGTVTVSGSGNADEKGKVVINGKDGSIGLTGKDGTNGLTIRGDKGADGVDGANGTDGITRIIYETPKKDGTQGVDKHEVATLDDGLKFGGNSGETYKKLNTKFDIKGAGTTWADFDQGKNIMTQVDSNGVMTIALAKALKGLTSAEFKNTAGDTTVINGDGIKYNPKDNTDTKQTVSLGKDGINAGSKIISNVATGVNEGDAVNKKQAETIAKDAAKDFAKDKLKAGDNVTISAPNADGEVTISATDKDTKTTVIKGSGIEVTGSENGDTKTYTVGLDTATMNKINNAANATNAMQSLNVKAGTVNAELDKTNNTLEFATGNNLKVELDAANRKVTYSLADDIKFNNIKTDTINAGKDGSDGTPGKNGTVTVSGSGNADEKGKVVINGKDGSIGLTGKDGTNGLTIRGDKGADGVDGANGTDGITRIIYETPKKDGTQGVDKHEVATLDDGLKFGGNSGETYKKLNTKFDIKGAGTTWADFDQGKNIMTQVDSNGVMTIALAKALKGLTSAEFKNTAGDTTVINGDGIKYNPKDNTDTKQTVSLGKDGINAGSKIISNVATGVNEGDAVNKKQAETIAKDAAKDFAKDKLKAGDNVTISAPNADGEVTISATDKDTKTTVIKGSGIEVTGSENGDTKTYTVGLDTATMNKINNAANATNAMQSLNVKAGTVNAELDKTNNTLEFATGNNLKVELDAANRKVTYSLADDIKFNNIKTDTINAGKDGSDGTPGKNGTVTVSGSGNADEKGKVVINGKDGSIGLTGKDGTNGLTIRGDKGADGVDGANGTDGITRIIYETPKKDGTQGVDKHEVATLDDGLKFGGNSGETYKKLNTKFDIKGAGTTWADFDQGKNIMTQVDSNGVMTIALAKALKGLTSAEFKNTAGDTTVINGDGIKYNPKDNTDTKQTVSLGKDGINAGSKIISNVATGVNEGDAVNKKQAETIAKDAAKDFAKDKLKAGDNVTISAPNADGEVTISATDKDTKTTVIKGSGIEVTGSENGDTKTYTVGLDTATMNKINNAANATNAMQSLNVKAGTVNAELDKTNNTLEFATGNNLKVELDAANRKVTYSLADDIKFNNIKTDTINAGKDGSDGTPGKNGTVTVSGSGNADEKGKVVINGKDGSIGLTGKDGTNGLTIRGDKGADGVDGANGTDGITRIIYETPKKDGTQGVDKHEVATLDDGLKFGGNSGETYKKLNTKFDIKGAGTTWADFDQGKNIMTQVDSNGVMTIALAKALKGLTSAEFKNTAGDTTVINGDGIKYNPKDNTDTKQTVSLGKDGINAGSKIISNVATGVNEGDAVNKKQAETIAKDAAKDFAKDKLKAGDNVTISAPNADGEVTISATDKDTKTTVIKGSGIEVTGSENGDTKTYTVGLDTATMNKINNAANATNAMQSLNVKAGTVNAELDKTNNTLEFATGNNLKVELDAANRKVTYSLADDIKFNNIKTDTINAGKDGSDGTPGKNGTVTVSGSGNADEKGKVVINGKDGSIGLTGKDGTNGLTIRGDKGADGVDGANGTDGITRIIYETPKKDGTQGVDKHEVATLDDGLKFGGNSGETYKKLNTKFDIKGAGTTWADFDQGKNIMTQVDSNGVMTIALAKALKGLTSAEFKNTAGDTTVINGDGIKYNPKDNTDTKQTVSLGKDGINAGSKIISNVATGVNEGDAVNKKQAETIAKDAAKDFAKDKLKAGDNVTISAPNADGEVTISATDKDTKTTVIKGSGIEVTGSENGDTKTYTVGLDTATMNKINNAANATNAMQSLNVKAGTVNAELDKTNNTLEFATGNNLKVELDAANRKVTYSLADDIKFNNIKTDTINAGKDGSDGTPGKNGTVTVSGSGNADEKGKVVINGKDGSIGLTGKDGTNGLTIRGDKGADGVDGANGTDGITRIIYETPKKDGTQGVDKHEVATLDDGLKFGGNSGETYKKLNTKFDIKGAGTTWADFDQGKNIMTQVDSNGVMTIALAKALKGLTSAEFKNTAGDTTVINGDGIKYNPKDNTDTKQTVSLGKDGINAGSKIISNVATGVNEGDAVNKKQAETIAKDAAKDFAKDKLKAGDNVTISAPNADGEVTISATDKDTKTTVIKGSGIEVTGSENGDTKTYTVGLDTATMNKINNAANATNAMQSLNVKAGTVNAELDKTNNTLEFATGNNLKVELDAANRKVTYSLADDIKFNNIKTDTINAGKDGSDGTPGKNGTVTVSGSGNADEKGKVVINGKDGSIGLTGKDGTNGLTIRGDKGADGVDGANGTDGITRIIYETPKKDGTQGVDKHEVATLDDGLKFGGNSGETYKKLNTKFDIKGAGTTWADFDQGKNIMTQVDSNGVMTIALAKALKGLTSAEFKNTAGDTTVINGDGIKYNPKDNTDTKQTVSLGKDGINAGSKIISNVATGVNEGDAVNKKQMDEAINKAVAASNTNTTALTFVGDVGETKAKNGKITIAGGQTDTNNLSDKPNIGVVAKDGKLNIKLAKDIEVDSVTAKDKITVGEGANKITIADGKITGITSAVDPNGNLAKTLADIGKNTSKTDADKAKEKKAAIQAALKNVDNGSVATVGDLKNVTNGLDSVVENVNNITSNVTNITNITNMVVNPNDKENIDKVAEVNKKYQSATNDKEKQKIAEEAKEIVKANKIKTYNPYETTVKNNTTIVEAIQNMNERGIKFIHVSEKNNLGINDDFAFDSDDSRANMKGSIGIGMSAASTAENAIATGTNSKASGENSIATGTDSQASGLNSIAMGNGAQAIGKNTISIGTGNKVTGINSGAIGDPTTLDNVNGVYSMGNDNFIQGGGKGKDNIKDPTARDIFAIGNNIGSDTKKVTDAANYSVILGSKGYSDVEKGVALGYGSNADRKALTTDKEKASAYNGENNADVRGTIRGDYGAVSVGDGDHTRQIINVAAGRDDSDAVNVAQLKAATSQIMASTNGISMNGVTIDPNTGKQVNINKGNISKYAPEAKNINSVAIGANSVANRANTVSVGSAGNERIIANVADGVAPTDAANMRQLQSVANMVGEVKKDAMAGTASAMAIGNLPQATIPGKGMMAIGAGYYKGQTATALGVSKMSENGKWVFKASASYDSQRNVGAAGAIGFHF